MHDFLIVGAGMSGLVAAERLCGGLGKRCLMVDTRDHIGGNCYDYHDRAGVRVHKYGPHYFRTNSPKIVEYLSRFTDWHPVEYKIKSWADGRYWNFPINLNTFEQLIGRSSTSEEMEEWLETHRVPIENPKNSEEVILAQVGHELYEKFFLGYTQKQWKRHPRELDASVCGRIPIRTNRDDRYLKEDFQALPKEGYTAMFERMVEACGDRLENGGWRMADGGVKRISVDPASAITHSPSDGPPSFFQPAMQVNYPNDHDFTRIVEIKHATGQQTPNTTIVREYPEDFGPGKEPYYPVPTDASKALYQQYKALADAERDVTFIGRLATYRYYNMDQVVGMALRAAERLESLRD